MGWTFSECASKNDVVKMLTNPWTNELESIEIIKHRVVDNVLWIVQEAAHNEGAVVREILCVLLEENENEDGSIFGWGYKVISEVEGPFYYSCPLKYLQLVDEVNASWRARVKRYHAGKFIPTQVYYR